MNMNDLSAVDVSDGSGEEITRKEMPYIDEIFEIPEIDSYESDDSK